MAKEPRMRIAGVARQSRGDGASIEEQVARLRAEAVSLNAELVAVYEEQDVSGGRALNKRPGLSAAVADVEDGRADVVMGAYFDRLMRSLETQRELVTRVEAAGGRVRSLDFGDISNGTVAQWLSSNMIGLLSEYVRRSAGERNHSRKQEAIDRGVPPFPNITPAYDRNEDGTLRQSEHAPLIREAAQMRLGGATFIEITRWLRERGVEVTPTSIQTTLASPLLVGELHFGKTFRPNLHAVQNPVLDQITYQRLKDTRASRGRYGKSDRLLARLGVLRCASCDGRMTVKTSPGRKGSGKSYAYYRCPNELCEAPANVSAPEAEQVVSEAAIRFGADLVGRATLGQEVEAARLARDDASAAYDRGLRLAMRGHGDEEAAQQELAELRLARDLAVDQHDRLLARTRADVRVVTAVDFDRLTFAEQRDFIRELVARAAVAPGRGPGRISVDPLDE